MLTVPLGGLGPAGTLDGARTVSRPLQALLVNRQQTPAADGSVALAADAQTQARAADTVSEPPEQLSAPTGTTADSPNPSRPLGMPLPYYYAPREVSERAKPIQGIDLQPPELDDFPGTGILILVLYIGKEGSVDYVDIVSSQLDPSIENAVVSQFRHAKFAPAKLDGQPVGSRMKIEVLVKPPMVQVLPPRAMPGTAKDD
jgi:hypothetical protein